METARLVAERAALERLVVLVPERVADRASRGSAPDILDHLVTLKGQGVDDVLVCPVGFVSDHLEIRWDIDHEAKERPPSSACGLERIAMPNADPDFVDVLAGIVRRELAAVAA